MSSSKDNSKSSPKGAVSNVTPSGGGIDEQDESHELNVIYRSLELYRSVEKLFTLDTTHLERLGAWAPACLTPVDLRPLGEWMAHNFTIPQLALLLQSSSMDLSFPNMATYDQLQHIESENLELDKLTLYHYNASIFSNTEIKKKLSTGYRRPSIISTCKRAILSEDLVIPIISWTPAQKSALEDEETRVVAQMAANNLQIDTARWLYDFLVDRVTAKDTNLHTSLEHLLKFIPRGNFFQAWYTLFYVFNPRVNQMFDVSKSTFYMIKFPTNKDLSWLENEIYSNRFDWSLAHEGEDIGEEECCKAVIFAISGFTLFEAAAERLKLEFQNQPHMTAKAAIKIVRLVLQSIKTSERL